MYGVTHLVAGAVVQKAAGRRWWLTIPAALTTHWLLDYFNWGGYTPLYHGRSPWTIPLALAALPLLWFGRRYWLGMFFAIAPDLEWIPPYFGAPSIERAAAAGQHLEVAWGALHHRWMYHPIFKTEWGIAVQAGLVALGLALVLLPERISVTLPTLSSFKRGWRRVVSRAKPYQPQIPRIGSPKRDAIIGGRGEGSS